jgi:hypothetical protein
MTKFSRIFEFYEDIVDIISTNVIEDKILIYSFYESWEKNFFDTGEFFLDQIISKSEIHKNQGLPSDSKICGIDLPTWFGDFSSKKIIFIGIDPMRNERDFKALKHADKFKDAIVGTPYAFHKNSFRNGRSNLYWKLIEGLSKDNFIYVTDIYKSFFYTQENVRSYDFYTSNKILANDHFNLLECEIEAIQPDYIITFGKLSYELLTNKKLLKISDRVDNNLAKISIRNSSKSVTVIPLVHLSGSVRNENLHEFIKRNSIHLENFKRALCPELYLQILERYLL